MRGHFALNWQSSSVIRLVVVVHADQVCAGFAAERAYWRRSKPCSDDAI